MTVTTIQLQAQEYKFGKVAKHELEKKGSEIDADANAEYLYKKETVYYDFVNNEQGLVQKKEVHLRIKIYNKEGLNWANHSIKLYNESASKRTTLMSKKGYTYNLVDGKIEKTKLKNESIFKEELNEYWAKVSFAFPKAKEGSIIELYYKLEEPFVGSIDDIYVQDLIPIKTLDVKVRIPEYFNFKKLVNLRASFYPKLVESSKNRTFRNSNSVFKENVTSIKLKDIPPLKEEKLVDNLQNYIAKIVWEYNFFKGPNGEIKDYASNWTKVSKTIYDSPNFGGQLKKIGYFEEDLDALLSGVSNQMDKAAMVFQFVKSKVKWNDFYGKFVNKGVRKAYKDGSGNVAEINLMLTSMLRYAGLDANPVLVSTKSHGIPTTATIDGFNYVISAIELQNDVMLLDATDTYSVPNILPKRALNWQGRIIRKSGSSTWVSLQQRKPVVDSKIMNYKINSDLSIEGKIIEHKSLQLGQKERKSDSKLSEQEKIERIEDKDVEIIIENLEIKNEDDYSKPYVKSFNFKSDELVEEIGDKLYISPLLFYTTEESPFKEETRTYPIDFVYPFSEKYTINIMIPDGYELDYLPESIASKLSEDNISTFKYLIKKNGAYIQLRYNFDFNYSVVPVLDYVAFRQYFNAYLEKLSEKIVLKKVR